MTEQDSVRFHRATQDSAHFKTTIFFLISGTLFNIFGS